MEDEILWLQNWYTAHCNGDWEHDQRIRIETIDNPGWSISINLIDTGLQEKSFVKIKRDNSSFDWLVCFVEGDKFEGKCGSLNLLQVLRIFRNWVAEYEGS